MTKRSLCTHCQQPTHTPARNAVSLITNSRALLSLSASLTERRRRVHFPLTRKNLGEMSPLIYIYCMIQSHHRQQGHSRIIWLVSSVKNLFRCRFVDHTFRISIQCTNSATHQNHACYNDVRVMFGTSPNPAATEKEVFHTKKIITN